MTALRWLLPEILLAAVACFALFADRTGRTRAAAHVGAPVAVIAAFVALWLGLTGSGGHIFGGMLAFDRVTIFSQAAIALLTAVWLRWVSGRGTGDERDAEAVALALLVAVGSMLMVAARDLAVLYISVELSTLPAYVLAGYRRKDANGLEGALKYYLLSMLTSIVMLYGMSFVYGIAGSTSYAAFASAGGGVMRQLAYVLMIVGFLAKISAAPFHYWTPDAYAGAPAYSVAFISTVPKVAGAAALVSVLAAFGPAQDARLVLLAAAVLSMLIGNLAAYPQTDLRRLMAYSGVAHSGYVLLAATALTTDGKSGAAAAVYYAVAYALPSMAIMLIGAEEGTELTDLGGLSTRRPALAWASVAWLLSMVGIPPMIGFFGKLYLFSAALGVGMVWPVVLAVVMSVVSAGYYFRVLRAMFFADDTGVAVIARSIPSRLAFVALAIATFALGIGATFVFGFLQGRF